MRKQTFGFLARAAMTLLVILAVATAARAQTPYAIYCEGNKTLYFTYRTETLSVDDTFAPEAVGATAQTITALLSGTDVTETEVPGWYFFGDKNSVETVVFESSFANVRPKSTLAWFCKFESLTGIQGMENLNTSQVTDMTEMFYGCKDLGTLDLSSFDTRNVTDMSRMFQGCKNLTALDLSSFDTHNVTSMTSMFNGCGSLTTIDLSSFDTHNVTSMISMFNGCGSLSALDLSSFDTHNVTDMRSMFNGCGSLIALDLSSFDTHSVTNMQYMFFSCGHLTTLDLSSFDTHNVTDMNSMFNGCDNLRDIYVGRGWDTENVKNSNNMFKACDQLPNYDGGSTDKEHAHAGEDGYMLMHPMLTIVDVEHRNTVEINDAIDEAKERYDGYIEEHEEDEAGAVIAKRNNVTLSERTLYKDGEWNTLCLPFAMTARQVSASPLAGADIRTLTSASVTGYVVKLKFGKVGSLTAGTPYIVRWAKDDDYEAFDGTNAETTSDIVDPVFYGVTLSNEKHDFTSDDTHVKFIGYYDAFTVRPDDDPAVYYLTAGNMLKHTATIRTLKACRAYFLFTPSDDASANEFAFDIDFGDGTTGIAEAPTLKSQPSNPFWYTIDGRRLSGKPTQKGIYISNGRKVVIE